MIESAKTAGAPQARRERTRREITAYARSLTATVGLQGFTVEDLCDHAGISRRTFFNYFPGKEQAVIGEHTDELDEAAVTAFLDGRPDDVTGISPTLLDDLARFAASTISGVGGTPAEASAFIAAVQHEPKLFEHIMRRAETEERYLTMLVGTREGLLADHPVPQVAVTLILALVRSSMRRYIGPDNTASFAHILQTELDAAKEIFAASFTTPGPQ